MASVSICNVSVVFGKKKIQKEFLKKNLSHSKIQENTGNTIGLKNCTLEIQEGKILVLMGLSGSGKSTLLRTINGLENPIYGQVKIYHENHTFFVNCLRSYELQKIRRNIVSMVFQQFGLLPWRTVLDNVKLGPEISGIKFSQCKDAIMEQLELVGLKKWAEKPVTELSGGMQQRVGLARAFITGTPIILLDEPFSALDPLIKKYLQNKLIELQKKLKKTIVIVSHDIDEAIRIGDYIAFMKDGNMIQCNTPKEIIKNPINSDVSDFFSNINLLNFLTAFDIMQPYSKNQKDNFSITATYKTNLGSLIKIINSTPGTIGIVDHKNTIIGTISERDIIFHLDNPFK